MCVCVCVCVPWLSPVCVCVGVGAEEEAGEAGTEASEDKEAPAVPEPASLLRHLSLRGGQRGRSSIIPAITRSLAESICLCCSICLVYGSTVFNSYTVVCTGGTERCSVEKQDRHCKGV